MRPGKAVITGFAALALALLVTGGFPSDKVAPPVYADDWEKYVVYAIHSSKETFPLFDDPDPDAPLYNAGSDANYPEIATITFIAVGICGTYASHYGEDAPIKIAIRLKRVPGTDARADYVNNKFPYEILNLTQRGVPATNVSENLPLQLAFGYPGFERNFFFHRMLGEEGIDDFKQVLADINCSNGYDNVARNELIIELTEDNNGICTVVFKSWNYKEWFTKAVLELENVVTAPGDRKVWLDKKEITIPLDVNNWDVIRTNHELEEVSYPAIRPDFKKGQTYTGDPGYFVLKDTVGSIPGEALEAWQIHQVIEALAQLASGPDIGFPWGEGNGPDWLQFAAASICNHERRYGWLQPHNGKFFKCVWEIVTGDCGKNKKGYGYPGKVSPRHFPWRIYLDPWENSWETEKGMMRFDLGRKSNYGVWSFADRTGTIYHEAFHTYHCLPGKYVYDRDEDRLYVNAGGFTSDHLPRAFDGLRMGFIVPSTTQDNEVDQIFHSVWGDTISNKPKKNKPYKGIFLTRIDHKAGRITNLTLTDMEKIFQKKEWTGARVMTDLYSEMPHWYSWKLTVVDAFLYTPAGGGIFSSAKAESLSGKDWVRFAFPPLEHYLTKCTDYGKYKYGHRFFRFESCNHDLAKTVVDSVDKLGARLYVIYEAEYKSKPFEYDAEDFMIHRGAPPPSG